MAHPQLMGSKCMEFIKESVLFWKPCSIINTPWPVNLCSKSSALKSMIKGGWHRQLWSWTIFELPMSHDLDLWLLTSIGIAIRHILDLWGASVWSSIIISGLNSYGPETIFNHHCPLILTFDLKILDSWRASVWSFMIKILKYITVT